MDILKNGILIPMGNSRLVEGVWNGRDCFVCGHSFAKGDTNWEHIMPDWIQKEFNLHDSQVTLPNGEAITYTQYKIPCHITCNTLLGRKIENPASGVFKRLSSSDAGDSIKSSKSLLSTWMALVFLKIQLKDSTFDWHLDKRKGTETIAEATNAASHKIIPALLKVRCFLADIEMAPELAGTLEHFPVVYRHNSFFDFASFGPSQTIMFRFHDVALLNVVDGGTEFSRFLQRYHDRHFDAYIEEQINEIAIALAVWSTSLNPRPGFQFFRQPSVNENPILCFSPQEPVQLHWNKELFAELMAERFLGKKNPEYLEMLNNKFTNIPPEYVSLVIDNDQNLIDPKSLNIWSEYAKGEMS